MPRFAITAPSFCGLLLIASVAGIVRTVDAASIHYGDFGPDFPPGGVTYVDVTESSGTDDVPLYGPPGLTANTLDFDPLGFTASATDGLSDVTNGQLNFTMTVLEGAGAVTLLLSEGGDYTLFGAGTAVTSVAAGMSIDIDILEVDHTPLDAPISMFASNSIVRDLVSDGPVVLAPWSNELLIEFGPVLVANNIDFELGVTRAEVVIDDELLASSESQSIAVISKKDFRIEPGIEGDPIPEPGALVLLTLGGLAFFRRR
jgi:hypothetical protein